jgi:hypothetical protein
MSTLRIPSPIFIFQFTPIIVRDCLSDVGVIHFEPAFTPPVVYLPYAFKLRVKSETFPLQLALTRFTDWPKDRIQITYLFIFLNGFENNKLFRPKRVSELMEPVFKQVYGRARV